MEPQYRFCTSADGTRISFSTLGGGRRTPAINVVSWAQVQEQVWQSPAARAVDWMLAQDRCVVLFDRRGVGASQRRVEDLSLEAHVADVRAIAEQLEFEHADLWGAFDGNAVALAYAARYPEQVRRLALWSPSARGADVMDEGQARGLAELIRGNWELATRTIANVIAYPSGPVETQREFAKLLRKSVSPEVAARYIEFQAGVDVSALLPRVQAPTLIFHTRKSQVVPISAVRAVAELIPDARLTVLEGDSPRESGEKQLEIMREFLGEQPAVPAPGLVTILFTDLASSTALTQRLGDANAQELVRAHNMIVREALAAHGGTEIKHTGDGIMASFPTASGALECAVAIQRAVEGSSASGQGPGELAIHIGLNAGEPVAEESDLFGTSVQLARRICDHAQAGQILVSNVVRELAAGKNFLFADIGEVVPKGFEDPVRLYEVRWGEVDA